MSTTNVKHTTEDAALLAAGAVLPLGADGAGPAAVPLTARAYRHPALGDERIVVRLAAAELGAAEDLAAGFLGLVPDGEPAVVGLGRRRELGFPEWVLVHHPEDGHHALAVVPELDRLARQAKTKPKAALDACNELAERLAAAVPHFLPVFFEQAARVFLAVENTTYAAQLFGKARASEARYGLSVDEDRLDAVFLEFALAGALPVKVLTGYGKELALRVSPTEAFDRFRRLCVRRTAGGLAPSAQATTELRRLARAAGHKGNEPEQEYLAELLPLPATGRAAAGWWKAHRATLVALARRVPSVRGALLGMVPGSGGGEAAELTALWLEVLEESGATAGLVRDDLPAEERCSDGVAGWLERFHTARHSGWGTRPALPGLVALVTRCADRLRTELALPGREEGLRLGLQDVNLLDLLLSLGVAVAAPAADTRATMDLEQWANSPEPRDLRALCADERMRPVFLRTLDGYDGNRSHARTAVRMLATSPGSSALVAQWVRRVAAGSTATALPDLPDALRRMTWLPAEALALAPEAVAEVASTDLGAILARTLRGGQFEELTWPLWEEVVAEMAPRQGRQRLTVMDAWPYVIVANSVQVRVLGPDSTVLTHDLRIPADTRTGHGVHHGFHYADGDLLVFWADYDSPVRGYWLGAPDEILTLATTANVWSLRSSHVTLPLPGGGRATGGGVLHRGDTVLPTERPVISDGTSYWVWEDAPPEGVAGWAEYDPATGARGRRSLPAFLADALRDHPPGSVLHNGVVPNRLRPTPSVEGSVLGAPVDGVLGWRAVSVPGQGWHGSDNTGRRVTVPEGANAPHGAVVLPGDDRPRALSHDWRTLTLTDPEGAVTARISCDQQYHVYGVQGAALPPSDYWYCLRPRDPEGSAVLRGIDTAVAGALLAAAAEADKDTDRAAMVRAHLPGVTAPVLVAGVVDRVRAALVQRKALDRLAQALLPAPRAERAPVDRGPADSVLEGAMNGLVSSDRYRYGGETDVTYRLLRTLRAGVADTEAVGVPGRLHVDVAGLARSVFPWTALFLDAPAAVAYRAVVTGSTDERRVALRRILSEVDALGLGSTQASAGRWRRVHVRIEEAHLIGADGKERGRGDSHRCVLPLGGGALLALTDTVEGKPLGREFGALLHDPEGRFEVPAPYTSEGPAPAPGDRERGAGWLATFLEEAASRGPAPWIAPAAEEFGRLTGVSAAVAALVVAGLPCLDSWERNFLPAELRATLGITATAAAHARDDLRTLDMAVRRELVAALLPAEPARLWTEGPDAAAAATVWNRRVGRRTPVPEWLLAEASKEVRSAWTAQRALPALLDAEAAEVLSTDLAWTVKGDHVEPLTPAARPFDATVLAGAVAFTAWLAHRLPAGDPVRACLPTALTAVRRRLAAPGLLLGIGHHLDASGFRQAAGTPTETGEGFERFGAVVLATHDTRPYPAVRTSLLDSTGSDPYLPLLRDADQRPGSTETALRLAHDPAFAAFLADPGAPAAGGTDAAGTWWPQDPGRSVPELVAEVSAAYGLGSDAAALYLALLAMPDPTDRNTARWTGWKPARAKAARAELAATDLVVEAVRARAGRGLFLPGAWAEPSSPALPVEQWKLPMYGVAPGGHPVLGVLVPTEPAADLYRRAWARVREGDVPRFEQLKVRRTAARRR
ncbi:DNA-binding protein [Streptomyces sp. NPDC088097]|uniref:DNA-binding protein n=1 Tax=Streptomyces sp. NPDC088097 TaxID=3365823 RepID=UPI00380521FF